MNVISVDPSIQSERHAFVVWDCCQPADRDRKPQISHPIPFERGIFRFPKNLPDRNRLSYLRGEIAAVISRHDPFLVVLEGQFRRTGLRRRNISDQSVILLAKAAGLWETFGVPVETVPPDEWKAHFHFKKRWASDKMLEAYVNERLKQLNLPPEPNEHVRAALLLGFYWFDRKEDKK